MPTVLYEYHESLRCEQDIDMNVADYDGRTALHLCASEGHLECIKFLVETIKVNPNPSDR